MVQKRKKGCIYITLTKLGSLSMKMVSLSCDIVTTMATRKPPNKMLPIETDRGRSESLACSQKISEKW